MKTLEELLWRNLLTSFLEAISILSYRKYGLKPAAIERRSSSEGSCLSKTFKIFFFIQHLGQPTFMSIWHPALSYCVVGKFMGVMDQC